MLIRAGEYSKRLEMSKVLGEDLLRVTFEGPRKIKTTEAANYLQGMCCYSTHCEFDLLLPTNERGFVHNV